MKATFREIPEPTVSVSELEEGEALRIVSCPPECGCDDLQYVIGFAEKHVLVIPNKGDAYITRRYVLYPDIMGVRVSGELVIAIPPKQAEETENG